MFQSLFEGTYSDEAPPGIKIEVSIDEAIMAFRRMNDGSKNDVTRHYMKTIWH